MKAPKQHLLAHWYYTLRATAWLLLTFGRARLYFHTRALHDLALPHPETLTNPEKRRLEHYFYGGTYLSVIAAALRGRNRTRREKHRLTNLAALAYFFDDLVDTFRQRDDSGVLWQNNPEAYGRAADDERGLALHFLQNIYQELPPQHLDDFKSAMHTVFNVETAGRQQSANALAINELQHVTAAKGGHSVLLFRLALEPLPDVAEQRALLEFGHLIQLCDDIFDLWFDLRDGTATLATHFAERGDLVGLNAVFDAQVAATRVAFLQTSHRRFRQHTAWAVANFIVAITEVCLRHYLHLQKKHGALPLSDRRQMVVDMERWPNRVRVGVRLIRFFD